MKSMFLVHSHSLLASLILWTSVSTSAWGTEQPNIVVILADDCTYRDIGCYGGQALTPNIDRLADEGMKFEHCFQAAPMCSPTRHNLYTGLYPVKSGAYPNHTMVYPDVKTIVHYLQPLGYRVVQTGKLHVKPAQSFPWKRLGKDRKDPDMELIDQFLDQHHSRENKPFCLIACSSSPHSPWDQGDATQYPPASVKLPPYIVDTPVVRKNFSDYLAEITHFDSQVGKILQLIDKYELRESTLVMVLSEQGNSFPFAKWTCYDHGLQSALVVRWPGPVASASVSQAMVEYVDITPTLVDAAGGETIEGLDGNSFLPVLRGQSDHHKDHVYGIMTTRGISHGSEAYAIRSIRSERFKLILNLNHESQFQNVAMRSAFYLSMISKAHAGDPTARRLVKAYSVRPAIECFDLDKDPFELNNVADDPEYSTTITALKQRLKEWMADQGDLGVPTERIAHLRQPKNGQKNQRLDARKTWEESATTHSPTK